jgi:hypothetical protein
MAEPTALKLTAYKYSSNSFGGVFTAEDLTGAAITNYTGYTAGFTAKGALSDADNVALIAETVTITSTTTGAYNFTINANDMAAITDNSTLYCELWLRPGAGDKITAGRGTITISPTARIA